MSPQIEKILQQILANDVKVVSFDVFDTLLLRPCIQPTDIFKLAGEKIKYPGDFREMRRLAEVSARRKRPYGVEDVTLDEIYHEFAYLYNVAPDLLEQCKEAELAAERQLLYPRKTVQMLYRRALEAGKEVIITSDMYLPSTFLKEILSKNGYKGYARIYVSCEEKVCKGSGNLFRKIIADYSKRGILPNHILHVGDNYQSDITKATECKLRTAYIPKAYNEFKRRGYMRQMVDSIHKDSDNSFLIGFIANKLFDDPFTKFDLRTYFNGDPYFFTCIMLMPLLFSFSKWLLEEAIRDNIEQLVLVYRDGYLPEKIMQTIAGYYEKKPEFKKIYLSRAIRYNYYSDCSNGLLNSVFDLPLSPDMTVEHFIKYRLLATSEQDVEEAMAIFLEGGYRSRTDKIGPYAQFIELFPSFEPIFHKNAAAKRNCIQAYCEDALTFDKKTGVFDIGYRGSVSRFLAQNLELPNTCYHLFANPLIDFNVPDSVTMKPYLAYGISMVKKCIVLHPLIEDIISKQEGSALDVEKHGDRYEIKRDTFTPKHMISDMQNWIIALCGEFADHMKDFIPLLQLDHYPHFETLVNFLVQPNRLDAALINRLSFEDSKFIVSSCSVYKTWYQRNFPEKKHPRPAPKPQPPKVAAPQPQELEDQGGLLKRVGIRVCTALHIFTFGQKIYRRFFKKKQDESVLDSVVAPKVPKIDYRDGMDRQVRTSLIQLEEYDLLCKRRNTVVLGDMLSYDKGLCNYLNCVAKAHKDRNLVLLSEAAWINEQETRKKITFPFLVLPALFGKNRYPAQGTVTLCQEDHELLNEKGYLQWAVQNWTARHADMTEEYAAYLAVCAYRYFTRAFELLNAQTIILWNQFHALHHIIVHLAREMEIDIRFMEFGSLPGTLAFETLGQMGESYPAVYAAEFSRLPVSAQQLAEAETVLSYLKTTKMNRNVQAETKEDAFSAISTDKPVILYAGQNDYESGLYPYDEHAKQYHSPVFSSTNAALLALAEICEKNGWQLVYKPHPIIKMCSEHTIAVPDSVVYIEDADINEVIDRCDVTVTILSQVAYISLIREKPTLMLGYNQLKGKGCTYEAFAEGDIVPQLAKAVEAGFTKRQREAFVRHTAQMINYYLFDDMVPKALPFGQTVEQFFQGKGNYVYKG